MCLDRQMGKNPCIAMSLPFLHASMMGCFCALVVVVRCFSFFGPGRKNIAVHVEVVDADNVPSP